MPAVMKRLEEPREEIKVELLRTIRGDNFQTIGEQLPKPNYQPKRKHKIQKTTMEFEEKQEPETIYEIESLPILEKDKKLHPMENSDRVMSRDKLNVPIANRDRKKSEMGYSRSGLDSNNLNSKLEEIKQLKLPKVQNRYNRKEKGPKNNQNSLRCYKIFEG